MDVSDSGIDHLDYTYTFVYASCLRDSILIVRVALVG